MRKSGIHFITLNLLLLQMEIFRLGTFITLKKTVIVLASATFSPCQIPFEWYFKGIKKELRKVKYVKMVQQNLSQI